MKAFNNIFRSGGVRYDGLGSSDEIFRDNVLNDVYGANVNLLNDRNLVSSTPTGNPAGQVTNLASQSLGSGQVIS